MPLRNPVIHKLPPKWDKNEKVLCHLKWEIKFPTPINPKKPLLNWWTEFHLLNSLHALPNQEQTWHLSLKELLMITLLLLSYDPK